MELRWRGNRAEATEIRICTAGSAAPLTDMPHAITVAEKHRDCLEQGGLANRSPLIAQDVPLAFIFVGGAEVNARSRCVSLVLWVGFSPIEERKSESESVPVWDQVQAQGQEGECFCPGGISCRTKTEDKQLEIIPSKEIKENLPWTSPRSCCSWQHSSSPHSAASLKIPTTPEDRQSQGMLTDGRSHN